MGRKVFRFLREAARPDNDFIGWYEPTIGEQGKEPDFVLFGKQQGLLVLEVKDWLIDQIEEADPRTFKVWIAGREESRNNPGRPAKYSIYRGEAKDAEMKYFSTGGRYRQLKRTRPPAVALCKKGLRIRWLISFDHLL